MKPEGSFLPSGFQNFSHYAMMAVHAVAPVRNIVMDWEAPAMTDATPTAVVPALPANAMVTSTVVV